MIIITQSFFDTLSARSFSFTSNPHIGMVIRMLLLPLHADPFFQAFRTWCSIWSIDASGPFDHVIHVLIFFRLDNRNFAPQKFLTIMQETVTVWMLIRYTRIYNLINILCKITSRKTTNPSRKPTYFHTSH